MKKAALILVVLLFGFMPAGQAGETTATFVAANTTVVADNTNAPRPKYRPMRKSKRNKTLRKIKHNIFTVNVFKYNVRVRKRDDRQMKAMRRTNKHGEKAHKHKKATHILLKNTVD